MRVSQVATIVSGALVSMALIAGPSDLPAQSSDAMSWLPWSGCWVEVGAPDDAPMTCVVPEAGGAAFLTITRAGDVDRQMMAGDGVERPVDAGGCVGVEAAEFSRDGSRVYTRSTLSCDGGTERSTRGMIAMVSADEWIQVRALTVGEGSASWLKRYRLAPASRVDDTVLAELRDVVRDRTTAIEAARMAAAVPPSANDIIEAVSRTDAEAVRAWIVEQDQPVELDADALLRMADAGVSEEVIDVAIAVTYPEKFAVARTTDQRVDDRRDRYGYWDRSFGMYSYFDPFYYGYNRYDRYYNRYSPYGYGYGFGNRPTVIVVSPAGEARGGSGRVVKGRGYSPANPEATGRTARPANRPNSARSGQGNRGSKAAASSSSGSSGSKGKAKKKGGGGG